MLFLFYGCNGNTPNKNTETTDVEFSDTLYEFGEVSRDTMMVVCHEYKFRNVGKKPFLISDYNSSCGCTTVLFPKEPVNPGDTGHVTIKLNGKNLVSGYLVKTVTLNSNESHVPRTLIIRGSFVEN